MHEQHCLMMMCTDGLMHFLCLLSLCWCCRKGQNTYEIIIVCNGNTGMATVPVSVFFGLVNVCLMPGLLMVINQNTLYIINLQCTYKTFLITCNLVTCFFMLYVFFWVIPWHLKFRRWGIIQKKAYNIQNMAKVWNQEFFFIINSCILYHSCTVIIKVTIIIYRHNPLLFENS